MLVSIVIPCYNAENFVEEAVRSAYRQTYRSVEVIVVDDGSSDSSPAVLRRLQQNEFPTLRLLQHKDQANHGVSSTRRWGAEEAKGRYIAFLDSDDVFLPNRIDRQIIAFQANPEAILCHSSAEIIGDASERNLYENLFNYRPEKPYFYHKQADFLVRNGICCSSVLVKKELLLSVPFESAQLFQHEDWLCWSLLGPKGKFVYVNEPLVQYRVHPASATTKVRNSSLITHYSKLEMKLALAIKAETFSISLTALASALRTLLAVMLIYANKTIASASSCPRGKLYRLIQFLRRMKHGPGGGE